jgi:hypothetical protein
MEVIKNNNSWQVVTNFLLYNDFGESGRGRFRIATQVLSEKKGVLSETESMELLREVCQYDTVWSAVYNLNTRAINLVIGRQYDRMKQFNFQIPNNP